MYGTVVAAILALVGAIYSIWSVRDMGLAIESRDWPITPGVVTACKLLTRTNSESGDTYRVALSYLYSVQGSPFIAERLRFGDGWTIWKSGVERIMRKYAEGTAVTVRYDPDRPDEAVLEPGMNGFIVYKMTFGVLLLVGGVVYLASVWL